MNDLKLSPGVSKYQNELKKLKNKRYNQVLLAAEELFLKSGIERTTFNNIAEKASVGVASVYRYFRNKQDIVITVAESVVKNHSEWEIDQFNSISLRGTGREKLRKMLFLFVELYEQRPEYICFLSDFDSYVQKEGISIEKLKTYDNILQISRKYFVSCFQDGFEDKTIRDDIDVDLILRTITLSLITLSQKLLLNGNIVESDKELRGSEHILCLVDMCMNSI